MILIEKDGEYFDFDDELTLSKEVKALDAITSTATFSYQATMPDTAKNRRLLGIQNLDSIKPIYRAITVNLTISQTEYQASLRVEGIDDGIQFSVFTDSFDLISSLTGTLKDVRYYNYPFGTQADRQRNTSGYLDILINNGNNKFALNGSFFLNLVTCLYVKDIMKDIFNELGIKLEGELTKDWRYNHLLVSNNSVYVEYDEQYISDHTVYVGKQVNQSVTGATAITFPLETGIFYDPAGWWDTANSRIQTDRSRSIAWEINIIYSTPGANTISIRNDLGITVDSIYVDGPDPSYTWTNVGVFLPTRTYRVFITPDSGTIGVSSSSTAKFFVVNEAFYNGVKVRFTFDEMLPRFIVPEMDKADFVYQILSLFNPVIDYNPVNKVLTVDLLDGIDARQEEDWSEYLDSYSVNFTDVISNYAKRTKFVYDEGDEQFMEDYNLRNDVPFGGGVINVENDFIEEETELLSIDFPPTVQEQSDAAQAYLPTMAYFDEDGNEQKFNNRLLLGIPNIPLTNFSNLPSINSFTSMAYGWFVKPNVRKPIDAVVENIAFDNPYSYNVTEGFSESGRVVNLPNRGYTGQTLKSSYFKTLERITSDPMLVIAEMYLPESVFHNFNPRTAKRLKTKDFNCRFIVRLIEGWEASHLPCRVELIKI